MGIIGLSDVRSGHSSLEYSSLLAFERNARDDKAVRYNLEKLFGLRGTPCNTAVRERLDQVDPFKLRGAFKQVYVGLQRSKALEEFSWVGH